VKARALVPSQHRRVALKCPCTSTAARTARPEIEQRITEDGLVGCPTTGQKVERVLQPFTPRYKGTGFYSTDHWKSKVKEQRKGGE
jgi:predicted nucleic acid-binding Zn ribbon protein